MKRHGHLRELVLAWPNLIAASRQARRRKRSRRSVAEFEFFLEYELTRLRNELISGSYRPGRYKTFEVIEPKRRLISAAPYRDRVTHHALCNIIEPLLDQRMIADSFACRTGKGTHAATRRAIAFATKHRYVLKADIRKFFPSIDHEILKSSLRRAIKDPWVLELTDQIIDNSNPQEPVLAWFPGDNLWTPYEQRRGLPIGNLTSQLFANWMLNGIDHWLTEEHRVAGYVRYCDDMLIFGDTTECLRASLSALRCKLADLRLSLHTNKCVIYCVEDGVPFLGYRVFPRHCLIDKRNVARFRRRMRDVRARYSRRELQPDDVRQRVMSWLGHLSHTRSQAIVERTLQQIVFTREMKMLGRTGEQKNFSLARYARG